MINLIHQPDTDNISLYAKYQYEEKYQFSINKLEGTELKYLNDSKVFNQQSNGIDDIYKNIEEYNPNKKHKILLVFDDIADMLSNQKLIQQ